MHFVIDRAKELASSSGTTSPFTLGGAEPGFVAFSDKLTTNGDTTWYCAVNDTEWEVGLGTRASSTTLTRTTILSSSNAGAIVNFSAAPLVFSTVPGAMFAPLGGPAMSVYRTTDQSVTTATLTKVQFNAETFDTDGCFDSATNYRFTPTVPGYYAVSWLITGEANASLGAVQARLYKNGTEYCNSSYGTPVAGVEGRAGSSIILHMNGTTDYLEVFAYISSSSSPRVGGGASETYFSAHLARAA